MPSSCDKPPGVTEEEMACTVLNRFAGIPEQTYENFISTFTYLPQESQACQMTGDSENCCSSFENTPARKSPDGIFRSEVEGLEQLIISEGENVGCCHSLTHSGRVQVDNFLSASDMETNSDEETCPHLLLYPGEAEPEVTNSDNPIRRRTRLDIQTSFLQQPSPGEHLGDDIQPFTLDRNFDYDCVALTPKFSAAELDFLKGREHGKTEDKVMEEQSPADS